MIAAGAKTREPWQERLTVPNYQVREAARYSGVSTQTITNWQDRIGGFLPARDDRASLSYLQLIEVAVVAAFRKSGIKLARIREAREYVQSQLKSEYPFADYKFKEFGKRLMIDYAQVEAKSGKGKLLEINRHGQLAWEPLLKQRLNEFDYDKAMVLRWHLGGAKSKIIIDPQISFGSPSVSGIPTWAIKGRWMAGDSPDEIADDFDLSLALVAEALRFEGVNVGHKKGWVN